MITASYIDAVDEIGKNIVAQRKLAGLSQTELAKKSTLRRDYLSKIETGAVEPGLPTMRKIAKALDVSVDKLTGDAAQGSMVKAPHRSKLGIPIINKTPAGPPVDYEDVGHDQYDYAPIGWEIIGDPDAFGVQIIGNSMAPKLVNGEIAIFSPKAPYVEGDIFFLRFGEEGGNGCTVKRVFKIGEDRFELRGDNQDQRPMIVARELIVRASRLVAQWKWNR